MNIARSRQRRTESTRRGGIVTSEKRSKAHNNVNNSNNNGTRGQACGRRVEEGERQGWLCVHYLLFLFFYLCFIYLFVNKIQIKVINILFSLADVTTAACFFLDYFFSLALII